MGHIQITTTYYQESNVSYNLPVFRRGSNSIAKSNTIKEPKASPLTTTNSPNYRETTHENVYNKKEVRTNIPAERVAFHIDSDYGFTSIAAKEGNMASKSLFLKEETIFRTVMAVGYGGSEFLKGYIEVELGGF